MKKRILSAFLALAMTASLLPVAAGVVALAAAGSGWFYWRRKRSA